jgi:hypothetical protein
MLGGSTVNFGEKIFLAKADSNGTILWSKYYGTSYCWGSAAQQTSDGGFMIAGRIDTASMLDYDMYLLKTDSAGNPQWGKMYIADYSLAYDASQTSDGGYILGGFRNNNFMQMGPASLYLIKTDSLGNSCENVDYIAAATSFTLTLIPSGITSGPDTFPATTPLTITESGASIITDICIGAGIDAIIKNTSSLQIFPNPSDGNFSLVSESMILNGEVEIVSMLGKTVYRSSLSNESSKEIHLNHAIPGIYFVTVFDGNKYHVMKLVIERI